MQRDMDLIRRILLTLEDHPTGFVSDAKLEFEGYTESQVRYHVFLLHEGGYIDASDVTSLGEDTPSVIPYRVTWHGHELAAAFRNDTVWAKTKAGMKSVGTASLPVWRELATSMAKQVLGLP
jgi:hypothetical protein